MKHTGIILLLLVAGFFTAAAQNTLEESLLDGYVLAEVESFNDTTGIPDCQVGVNFMVDTEAGISQIQYVLEDTLAGTDILNFWLDLSQLGSNTNVVSYTEEEGMYEIQFGLYAVPPTYQGKLKLEDDQGTQSGFIHIY